jgi:superfamily I DNA/RNA helicase
MRRVARLLEEGVPPEEILLISFTRTAAHDLRTKVADLGVPGAEDVRATTLHAYCFSLLQRDAVLAITRRTPRPLMDHEVDMMLRDIPVPGTLDEKRDMLRAYEAGWARRTDDHPGLSEPEDRRFEVAVLRWLRRHNAMLIGEVVPLAYNYLRDNPMAEERTRYREIVVDEYQDLNALEQALLDLLAEDSGLCVAGDDDQSIYRFRYANPEGILAFRDRGGVQNIDIDICGRCPRSVLAMANELISHAPSRDKEPLTALQEVDGRVAIVQWSDLDEEIEGLTAAIARSIQDGERQPGDILLLVHRQRIGERFRRRLNELGIPAHSFFAQESVASEPARRGVALLRLALGEDPASLRVLLGLGAADARVDAYRRLTVHAHENGESVTDVLDRVRRGERISIRVPALADRYSTAMDLLDNLPRDHISAAIDYLFPPDVPEVEAVRALALEELPGAETLSDLADALIRRITQHDVPESPDFVRIMSLHKSKGLTSPVVYVAAMVDGIVPTVPSRLGPGEADAAFDEQRRLTYVAITRASDELVISSSAQMNLALASSLGVKVVRERIRRVGGDLVAPTIASPYLAELARSAPAPVRGLVWLGRD